MVGKVQSVIRDLAGTGWTMIIVTHEMAFARAVCNRVFCMNGGTSTRKAPRSRFSSIPGGRTRRLKVLEQKIDSRDYDFIGMENEIARCCGKNRISHRTSARIQLAFEEAVHMLLMGAISEPHVSIVMEYSEMDRRVVMTIRYRLLLTEADSAMDELALGHRDGD